MKTTILKTLVADNSEFANLASMALDAIKKNDEKVLVKLADAFDKEYNKTKPKEPTNPLVGAYAEIVGAYIELNGEFPVDASKVMEWALLHAAFTEGPAFFSEVEEE